MTYKYILWSILLLGAGFFYSCLNSDQVTTDALQDAQIYAFSATAAYDSTETLANTKFSIDQLNSQIFNKDSLEFGFEPKNALLSITTAYASAIKFYLTNPDSTYYWNSSDSVAINRLKTIEITAQDQKTIKRYDFKLNIHKQDPEILNWTNIQGSYVGTSFIDQKTILLNGTFFTYYSTPSIRLSSTKSPGIDGWQTAEISSLPQNTIVSSFMAGNNTGYAVDAYHNVYSSNNGTSWTKIASPYGVKAIYGVSPNTTDSLLTIIDVDGALKFAKTKNNDFVTFSIKNSSNVPFDFPIRDFSCISISRSNNYTSKYYVISGGITLNGNSSNKIWFLQEKGNIITSASFVPSFDVQGSTLFAYNDNVYILSATSEKNILRISKDNGLTWTVAGDKQALPTSFSYRHDASIIVDSNNFIWIFGGISGSEIQFADVWRGRLNSLAVN